MRTFLALLALVAGVGALGYWATVEAAPHIESKIAKTAQTLVAGKSRHGVNVTVSGRDIAITGIAHSIAERDRFLSELSTVQGARLVEDKLEILAAQRPYTFDMEKTAEGMNIRGFVPDLRAEKQLSTLFSDGADVDISVASGEPNADWVLAIEVAYLALQNLDAGMASVIERDILVIGTAATNDIAINTDAAGNTLPQGYVWRTDIRIPLPAPELIVTFDAIDGFKTSGAVPKTLDIAALQTALGTTDISGTLEPAQDIDVADMLTRLKGVAPYFDAFDKATLTISPKGTTLGGAVLPDVDAEQMDAMLRSEFTDTMLDIRATDRSFAEGMGRINPATGVKESFSGRYWLPDVSFIPTETECATQITALSDGGKIAFAPETAQLALSARNTINQLFGVGLNCLIADDVAIRISGIGDDAALAEARAESVSEALIARGMPKNRLLVETQSELAEDRDVVLAWVRTGNAPADLVLPTTGSGAGSASDAGED